MRIYSYPTLSEIDQCPYLDDEKVRYRYFFADELNEEELDYFISLGFRKFGQYFFKPECPQCQKCQPLRVVVDEFKATKSQRRILNKNKETLFEVKSLIYDKEIYDLYVLHSKAKFDIEKHPISSEEEFIRSHFTKTAPALLTLYKVNNELAAVGFLDIAQNGISSVYFIYDPKYSDLSLGTYGVLREIELAKEMEKDFYYLGFYISENRSMNYKANFKPHQILKGPNWT